MGWCRWCIVAGGGAGDNGGRVLGWRWRAARWEGGPQSSAGFEAIIREADLLRQRGLYHGTS